MSAIALFALFSLACSVYATPSHSNDLQIVLSESQAGWYDPRDNGGRLLDYTTDIYGEPLNVIISGLSDPFILTDHGFAHYTKSLGYSRECLGFHLGNRHGADLGDGEGIKLQQVIARQHYFPVWGTCWESLAGESLVRTRAPSLTLLQGANTSGHGNKMARLLTVVPGLSEQDSRKHHMIVPDGYNIGRDWFVQRAISGSYWRSRWWKADIEWRTDLIQEGSDGVNHGIPQDGRIAILTVRRL